MPLVNIIPPPESPMRQSIRRRFPRAYAAYSLVNIWLKDRRYYYFKQGAEFPSLTDEFNFPSHIEIETVNRCNNVCGFCPVNRFDNPRTLMFMSEELFSRILTDLAENDYRGLLNLYSNNEPFLDKRIFTFARLAREKVPCAHIQLFTNGIPLTPSKAEAILESLSAMTINNYSTKPQLNDNVREIVAHIESKRPDLAPKLRVQLRLLDEFKSSRAGTAPNRKGLSATFRSRCAYPFFQMVIRPDGKVSLCCNDALGQETLGDLSAQSIREAWADLQRQRVRTLMLLGRDQIDLCRRCDNLYVAKPSRVRHRDF